MQTRQYFEIEVEEDIFDMVGWDLPGLTTRRAGLKLVNHRSQSSRNLARASRR